MKNILLILAIIFLSINVSYAQSVDTLKVSSYEFYLISSDIDDLLFEVARGNFENDPDGLIKAKCLNRLHLLEDALKIIFEENLKNEEIKTKVIEN